MSKYLLSLIFFVFSFFSLHTVADEIGKVTGGIPHEMPSWFKSSFLEFEDDVLEADEESKHVMIFFHLNNCPYCATMVDDFDANKDFITTHFDTIAINIKGNKEVALSEEQIVSETELADILEIEYTPTMLFLDSNNTIVARANGYRTPERMQIMFDFVRNKQYNNMSFVEYAQNFISSFNYKFISNDLFQPVTDLSVIKSPLAIIFEDDRCFACEYFHHTTLNNPEVLAEFKKYNIVRLNAKSNDSIITPVGKKMSIKQFANELAITYRPGVVLFDNNKEEERIDGFLYTYHFATILRYIANKYYLDMPFREFSKLRREELLNQGIDINLTK